MNKRPCYKRLPLDNCRLPDGAQALFWAEKA
jgi:hypothetical protein